jgi:iron(III) transport system substrate-binding protein
LPPHLGYDHHGFLACRDDSAIRDGPPLGPEVWNYLATLDKTDRLAALEHEATREGEIVIYGVLGLDRAQLFIDLFRRRYPGVKVEIVRLTTNDLPQKLLAEFRSNRGNADLIITSADSLELISKALAPYEPTSWEDFDARFRHGSRAAGWAAMDFEMLVEAIAWRSDRITRDEAPKTLDEVALPKWRKRAGTVLALEHLFDAFGSLYGEAAAIEKIQALAKLENHIYPSIAALSEGLSAGEIDLAWGIGAYRAARLKATGVPVDFVFEDPTLGLADSVMISGIAPHPYAAALMMEFLTDAKTLEQLDKLEPARTFGNLKGRYEHPLSDFPNLTMFTPIPPARYKELNKNVQRLFVRN